MKIRVIGLSVDAYAKFSNRIRVVFVPVHVRIRNLGVWNSFAVEKAKNSSHYYSPNTVAGNNEELNEFKPYDFGDLCEILDFRLQLGAQILGKTKSTLSFGYEWSVQGKFQTLQIRNSRIINMIVFVWVT